MTMIIFLLLLSVSSCSSLTTTGCGIIVNGFGTCHHHHHHHYDLTTLQGLQPSYNVLQKFRNVHTSSRRHRRFHVLAMTSGHENQNENEKEKENDGQEPTHSRETNNDDKKSTKENGKQKLEEALVLQQRASTLRQEAERLRKEATSMKRAIEEEQIQKKMKQIQKVDQWIEELLTIQFQQQQTTLSSSSSSSSSSSVELLKSVDQVWDQLQRERYSKEQVMKIFERLCETGPGNLSRTNCSPIMETFVDAVGKMDEMEREDNPNKRWSGRVERVLRKKLFAKDWGLDYEEDEILDDGRSP